MHRNSMKINYNIEFNVPACHPWLWMAAGRQLGLTCPIKCLMHVNFHIKCKWMFVIVGNIKSMWIVEKSMAERFNYEFVEWLTLLFEQQQILVGRHRDLMAQISMKYRNVNWFSVCREFSIKIAFFKCLTLLHANERKFSMLQFEALFPSVGSSLNDSVWQLGARWISFGQLEVSESPGYWR